jgi:HEAT repeat protein
LNAAAALRRASGGTVAQAMHQLVEDPSVRIRLVAANALLAADSVNPKAIAVVVKALSNPVLRVRRAALELVESLASGCGRFSDVLKQRALKEEEPALQEALARILDNCPINDNLSHPDNNRVAGF